MPWTKQHFNKSECVRRYQLSAVYDSAATLSPACDQYRHDDSHSNKNSCPNTYKGDDADLHPDSGEQPNESATDRDHKWANLHTHPYSDIHCYSNTIALSKQKAVKTNVFTAYF